MGTRTRFDIDRPVFFPALLILLSATAGVLLIPGEGRSVFAELQSAIVATASWFYVLVIAAVSVMVVVLALSRYGDIKLGPDHAKPAYGFASWFSMLFAAGVGIGLMFYGVAEPVMHYLSPPAGEAQTSAAAAEALQLTFFHWGFNAWAVYAVVAMMLAYFAYRHDLPLTLRSAFYPLIGDRIYGPMGAAVDVFAVICTTYGISVSLGLGVLQINAGMNYLFDLPIATWVQVILIFCVMALATISVLLGLDTGIKKLSEANTLLAVLLLIGILIVGPTVLLLSGTLQNFGGYVASLIPKTFNLYVYNPSDWLGGWTIFYWGWWISWAPFVGIFVARISRGRTIREFLLGVIIAPTLFICLWMGTLGGSAIDLIGNQGYAELGTAIQQNQAVGLFRFLDYLPGTQILSLICLMMIVIFFVTSADSGAMVLNMLSARGQDDTPAIQRSVWTVVIAMIASVLLVGGGLQALQTATIASALPFSVALLGACWGFWRALLRDAAKRTAVSVHPPNESEADHWRNRLKNLLAYPADDTIRSFQQETVVPAMREFIGELSRHGVNADVRTATKGASRLEVYQGEDVDFVYEVQCRPHPRPDATQVGQAMNTMKDSDLFYRAEVHLAEGGQDYDIMGWTREQVVLDILNQYEDHLHFLHTLR